MLNCKRLRAIHFEKAYFSSKYKYVLALIRTVSLLSKLLKRNLLGGGVLGDGLGSLRDGVLSQLSGQEETDSGLDFPGGDGGPLVVVGQSGSLGSDTLEDVVDEGVHDAHGLGGDTSVGVDLLQDLVDVDGVRLLAFAGLLLLAPWRCSFGPCRPSWQPFRKLWGAW